MSITAYEFCAILQTSGGINADHKTGGYDYSSVLGDVRKMIADEHASELAAAAESEDAAEELKALIMKYSAERMAGQHYDSVALTERIYEDMAGLGILTKYLQDPLVEEINGNSYDQIEIGYSDHVEFLLGKDAFSSPVEAVDIVKRMVRMGGKLLDAQTPKVDSFLGNGTRISASIPPTILEDRGVAFSIRKQNKTNVGRKLLIESGCATADILDFLTLCLCNKTSVGIAGGTGSGKTTLERQLANEYIVQNEDQNNRIYLIEDSHEIELIDYDDIHKRPARVVYNITCDGWPMRRFVADCLRYNPGMIIPAEVRDATAYDAASAGQVGHTILTSFHAESAKDAYKRLATLCGMAGSGESTDALLTRCIDAWPIMVYMEKLKDGTRKIIDVFEVLGHKDGQIFGTSLWAFVPTFIERDEEGRVKKMLGEHRRTGTLSAARFQFLVSKGVDVAKLHRLFPDNDAAGGTA